MYGILDEEELIDRGKRVLGFLKWFHDITLTEGGYKDGYILSKIEETGVRNPKDIQAVLRKKDKAFQAIISSNGFYKYCRNSKPTLKFAKIVVAEAYRLAREANVASAERRSKGIYKRKRIGSKLESPIQKPIPSKIEISDDLTKNESDLLLFIGKVYQKMGKRGYLSKDDMQKVVDDFYKVNPKFAKIIDEI